MDANTSTALEAESPSESQKPAAEARIPNESRYLIRLGHDTVARHSGRIGNPLYCLAASSEPHNNLGLNHAKRAWHLEVASAASARMLHHSCYCVEELPNLRSHRSTVSRPSILYRRFESF